MVADDEPDIRNSIFEILAGEGAEVVGVGNGKLALEEVLAGKFDMVVSDVCCKQKHWPAKAQLAPSPLQFRKNENNPSTSFR